MFDSGGRTVNRHQRHWLTIRQGIAAAIVPPVCALCGAAGQFLDEPWGVDLCACCHRDCPPAPAEILDFDAAFCLYRYQHPVDLMITRLKFHHELVFARVLGTLFARAWSAAGRSAPDCLIPLPLHRDRYRERGFCQTTEIARHVARRLRDAHGRPLALRPGLLRRSRATRAQSGLDAAARAENLHDAFEAVAGAGQLPRHVALLDDVLTTGHTAAAASAALKRLGIRTVEVWCCARAVQDFRAGPACANPRM